MNYPTTISFAAYLHRQLPAGTEHQFRAHLDACATCWDRWNRYRWDQAAQSPLYQDLKEFLGTAFCPYFDSSRALAQDWADAAPQAPDEIAAFFRSSRSYLYNLTIWEASGNRPPYTRHAATVLADLGAGTVLDYGCGIGSDTLTLSDHGFTVISCDYNSPSTDFLQWRAARHHGTTVRIWEPDQITNAPTPDTLWIIDTFDHIADLATLAPVLAQVDLIACEDLRLHRGHGTQGFHHRRSHNDMTQTLGHHGFQEITPSTPQDPTTYWTKQAPPNHGGFTVPRGAR